MIQVKNLCKAFGSLQVLKDVSVTIEKGEVISIIGPSGTGKSVFLNCLNGLIRPDGGQVFIDGVDITDKKNNINEVRKKMGMVYQNFNLFSHMTVLENIILAPMKILKLSRKEATEKAMELLELVCLTEKADVYPASLSGGQKQRIAIARAMAMEPEIILFDEPTSALDPTMVGEVLAVIRSLVPRKITMVIVTHEMEFAQEVANRIFYMDEMGIYEQGTPQAIFGAPQREKTKAFIGKQKTFTFTVTSKSFDFLGLCSQLDRFCLKYRIDVKTTRYLNLLIEEMLYFLLNNGVMPDIGLEAAYSEKSKQVQLTFTYGGKEYNPLADENDDLGLTLVRSISKETGYAFHSTNTLILHI